MKPNKIRVRLSKQYNNFFIIIGFILSAVTFGIVFYLFYSNFFEREDYLTRKRLLKWIKENKLPDYLYIKELNLYYWNIGAIEINLSNEQQVFVNFSCNDMLCRCRKYNG